MASLNLHVGEWVEVQAPHEILATLDETQAMDGLPFMPEMLQYCGKRFRLYKSAHKTCDTISNLSTCRMFCPRGIYPYWREIWLKRASGNALAGAQH